MDHIDTVICQYPNYTGKSSTIW